MSLQQCIFIPLASTKMAKAKAENGVKRVQNRHCLSRMAFLHQAAQHLAFKQSKSKSEEDKQVQFEGTRPSNDGTDQSTTLHAADGFGLSRRLASHILTVSRKVSIRASREMKHSICKRCSSILIPGQTAHHIVENKSRRHLKSCADVMVVTCSACGFEKRYPFGAQRQPRKKDRVVTSKNVVDDTRDPNHVNG